MNSSNSSHDGIDETGQVLYTALIVLGFDASAIEKKEKVPVNARMFARMNKKVAEHLIYFLFCCIDRNHTAKLMRDVWPIIDKRGEAQFSKHAFEWYKALNQKHGHPSNIVVSKSVITPTSRKFTSTLMALAQIALQITISKKRGPLFPLLTYPLFSQDPFKNRCISQNVKQRMMKHWINFAKAHSQRERHITALHRKHREMLKCYRTTQTKINEIQQKLQKRIQNTRNFSIKEKERFYFAPFKDVHREILSIISSKNEEIKKYQTKVDAFSMQEKLAWRTINPLLDGTGSLSHLDGSQYGPTVSSRVLAEHASEIKKMGLSSLYQDNKLDLVSLVEYANFSLKTLATHSKSHCNMAPDYIAGCREEANLQMSRVESLLESLSELRAKLDVTAPALNNSVIELRKRLTEEQDISTSFLSTSTDTQPRPSLCPPTPPLLLSATPARSKLSSKFSLLALTPGAGLQNKHFKFEKDETQSNDEAEEPKKTHDEPKKQTKENEISCLPDKLLTFDNQKKFQNAKTKEMEDLLKPQYVHNKTISHLPKRTTCKSLFSKDSKTQSSTTKDKMDKVLLKDDSSKTPAILKDITHNLINVEKTLHNTPNRNDITPTNTSEVDQMAAILTENCYDSTFHDVTDATIIGTPELEKSEDTLTYDSGCITGSETLFDAIGKIDITPKDNETNFKSYSKTDIRSQIGSPDTICNKNINNSPLIIPKVDKPDKNKDDYFSKMLELTDTSPPAPISHTEKNHHSNKLLETNYKKGTFKVFVQQAKKRRASMVPTITESYHTDSNTQEEDKLNLTSIDENSSSKFFSFLKNISEEKFKKPKKRLSLLPNKALEKMEIKYDLKPITEINSPVADKTTSRRSFMDTTSRLQKLLDEEDISMSTTKVKSSTNDIDVKEDQFESVSNMDDYLEKLRNQYLPPESGFDTLTDAVLCGATHDNIVLDQNINEQLRRESISFRRQSLSTARPSIGDGRRLSDAFSIYQEGIMDGSDLSLLSLSSDMT